MLNSKMEYVLNYLDKDHRGELNFVLSEVHSWIENNTIQFKDKDVWRWLHTNDAFIMNVYINDHEFEINSTLIDLLEEQFNTNFHKTLYCINLVDF